MHYIWNSFLRDYTILKFFNCFSCAVFKFSNKNSYTGVGKGCLTFIFVILSKFTIVQ